MRQSPHPERQVALFGKRLPPQGLFNEQSMQTANGTIDGGYSTPGSGNRNITLTPQTPFLCEIDTTVVPNTTVIVGRSRAEPDYPWLDIIPTPFSGYYGITKTVAEQLLITGYDATQIVYYDITLVNQLTATLAAAYSMPVCNTAHIYWPLCKIWWNGIKITRLVQQHYGCINLGVANAMAYAGPFAVTYEQGVPDQVTVGWRRDQGIEIPGTQLYDQVIVHPDRIANGYHQSVVVTGKGYIILPVTRQGTVAVGAPYWAAAIPGNTPAIMYVPLAMVGYSAVPVPHVVGIYQMQYGNIITDRTTANYCAP